MPQATALVDSKPTVLDEITALGFTANLVPQLDLRDIRKDVQVQVRESKHYAPTESKGRFQVQMTLSVFDPIVVTRDMVLVDGYTRKTAKLANKAADPFFPAYVIEVDYDTCTDRQKDDLHNLAATLNSNQGVPLTPREIRKAAERMIRRGIKPEEISRRLGLAPGGITQVRQELDATERMRRLGIEANGDFRAASLRALGTKDVLTLTDAPYRALALLTPKAGLTATEVKGAAKDALATHSETGALDFITNMEEEMRERIREKTLTDKVKVAAARQLRQHLGFINKYKGRAGELDEQVDSVLPLHVQACRDSVEVLLEVIRIGQSRLEAMERGE